MDGKDTNFNSKTILYGLFSKFIPKSRLSKAEQGLQDYEHLLKKTNPDPQNSCYLCLLALQRKRKDLVDGEIHRFSTKIPPHHL